MFNWADWGIFAILSISALISLKRGFVKEAMSLVIWLVALIIASIFSPKLAPLLVAYIEAPSLQQMAAFAVLFILTLLVGGAVNYLLATLIKATGLSGTDRLLGILFGLLRGVIIVMLILLYVPKIVAVDQDIWWQQSAVIPKFLEFEDRFSQLTSQLYGFIGQFFSSEKSVESVTNSVN